MKVLALCLCAIATAPAENSDRVPFRPLFNEARREDDFSRAENARPVSHAARAFEEPLKANAVFRSPDQWTPALLSQTKRSLVPENTAAADSVDSQLLNPTTVFRGQTPRGFFGGADPFNQPPGMAIDPYAGLPGGTFMYGANAPRPYEVGWVRRLETTYMPESLSTGGDAQDRRFAALEVDFEMEYTQPMQSGMMFRWTPGFGLRLWDGPRVSHLPAQAYRFSSDFELSTPQQGRWSSVIGFTPSLNSDLDRDPSIDSFNWDGRAYVLYQMNPFWKAMLGAQYWNRVDDYIIPHAGFIYTDDIWEMRLTVPEARISLFVGNELGCGKWIYVSGGLNIDSYEIAMPNGARDEVEFTDYRVMIGSRMDTGRSSFFFEGGWVFGRTVDFETTDADFDIKTNFVGRVGFRF